MGNATANRTDLLRVRETTWGETPANPALIQTRYTGEALDDSLTTEKSAEIRSNRMNSDLIVTDASPAGSTNHEFSFGTYDDLLESLLCSTWVDTTLTASDLSTLVQADDNFTSSNSSRFANIVVGQVIALSGFTNPLNNRVYTVTAKTNNQTLTLAPAPAAAESPASATVAGSYLRCGLLPSSYTLVKQFNDADVVTRQIFQGMRVGSFSLEMSTAAILTGVFNWMGRSGEWSDSGPFAGESTVQAGTNVIMNAVTNVSDILQDGLAIGASGAFQSLTFEYDNSLREQKGIGVLGNVGVALGQIVAGISGSMYFTSKAQAEKFKNNVDFQFSFMLRDNDGNAYIFTLFRCKFESYTVNSTGIDTDAVAEMSMTALLDPVTNNMMQITKIPAASLVVS